MGWGIFIALAAVIVGLLMIHVPSELIIGVAILVVIGVPTLWGLGAGVRSAMRAYVSTLREARARNP